jgi:hypothetical protein
MIIVARVEPKRHPRNRIEIGFGRGAVAHRDGLARLIGVQVEDFERAAVLRLRERRHKREQMRPDQRKQQPIARARRLLVVEMRRDVSARQMRPDGGGPGAGP